MKVFLMVLVLVNKNNQPINTYTYIIKMLNINVFVK